VGAMIKLEPRQAIAFTEREWKELLNFPVDCRHCWDPEYTLKINGLVHTGADEYFIVGAVDAPYAKIIVFGVESSDLILDWKKRAVLDALKKHKNFRKLLNRYQFAKIVWSYADMFDDVRNKKYPVFYVIVNDSKSVIEIP
jgi:hypothetical protein